jgi:uncharacterized membrane protein
MAEVDTTLLMEVLREIRSDVGEIKRDQRRLELRQSVVEGHLGNIIVTLQSLREELDEVPSDVRLIKKRLDLVEQD